MTREHASDDRRAAIDSRVDAALDAGGSDCLAPARSAAFESDERWYGRLLVRSFEATAGRSAFEAIVPAAAGIELLAAYCRLRSELVCGSVQSAPAPGNPTPALLSGDYLFASAYAAIGGVEGAHLDGVFEVLTATSETIIGAVDRCHATSARPVDHCSFFDNTAGALGRGAAVVGATLAGVDERRREQFAALGRGAGTDRQIRRVLAPGGSPTWVDAETVGERELRECAEQRRDDAEWALGELSATADVDSLAAFLAHDSDPGQ